MSLLHSEKKIFWVIFFAILFLNGCVYVRIEKVSETEFAGKGRKDDILLVEGELHKGYDPVAFVTVVGSIVTKNKAIDKRLKKEARKIGGDAVIFVTRTKESGHYPIITGLIVVFK